MKTYEFKDQYGVVTRVRLVRDAYADGSLAVQMLYDADGYWDFWGDVTVNLCDVRNQNMSYAYVDTNNMPAVADFLTRNGLATYTGLTRPSGFCAYPLYAFTSEFFETCANDVEEVR
ncbi:MAG: DUF4313 domain-containing protein [Atopobiaceae bacterium]|nr:DUF4313 domain-containing protein [Atopobiaceae bacterium]